jgi:ubiquitin C-terminal hydrolase
MSAIEEKIKDALGITDQKVKFQIVISSFPPYGTDKKVQKPMIEKKQTHQNKEPMIIQFINPFLPQQEARLIPKNNGYNNTAPKPQRGLTNVGNSCYFNALMQALCASPAFRKVVSVIAGDGKNQQFNLANSLNKGFNELLESTENAVNSEPIFFAVRQALANSQYLKNIEYRQQQDAPEILGGILNLLSDEAEKKSEREMFCENLVIYTKQTIECKSCKKKGDVQSEANVLQVALPANNLEQCIKEEFKNEAEAMEWKCGTANCTRNEAVLTSEITGLPKILIIHLKRFSPWKNGYSEKNCKEIAYGENLTLSEKDGKINYQLKAVINHGGGLGGGHYTATVLGPNGKWYLQNDSSSTLVDFKISPDAYLFLYEMQE